MERYRSGHNGADSKSVCGQPHVGSNPTRSAIKSATLIQGLLILLLYYKIIRVSFGNFINNV